MLIQIHKMYTVARYKLRATRNKWIVLHVPPVYLLWSLMISVVSLLDLQIYTHTHTQQAYPHTCTYALTRTQSHTYTYCARAHRHAWCKILPKLPQHWYRKQTDEMMDRRSDGRKDGRTNGRVGGRTDGRMDGQTNGRMDGRTNGRKAAFFSLHEFML